MAPCSMLRCVKIQVHCGAEPGGIITRFLAVPRITPKRSRTSNARTTVRRNKKMGVERLSPPQDSSAENGAEVDALVRAEVVEDVALEDVGDSLDRALLVRRVVVTTARHRVAGRDDVDLPMRVLESEEAAGHDGDQVVLVVNADEIRDLGADGECRA